MKCERCGLEIYKHSKVCSACMILLREKHPCYSLQELADSFGVTRERARQILKKAGRRTSSTAKDIIQQKKICPRCGKPKKTKSQYCKQCYHEMHTVTLTCSWCNILFGQYQSQVLHKIKIHNQENFFCGRKCQGKYLAEHHGFKRIYTIEEAAKRRKESCKAYHILYKKEIKEKRDFWNKHSNKERISAIKHVLEIADSNPNYKQLYDALSTLYPELFLTVYSLRTFLCHHRDLFKVEKHGKVILL